MTIVTVQRAVIKVGNLELDVFRLPDKSYRLSESGCENAIKTSERSFRNWLRSKSVYALPHKGFNPGDHKLKVLDEPMLINGVPFKIATSFWAQKAENSNKFAIALLAGFTVEGLNRRADIAFEVAKSEGQYNEELADFLERWYPVRDDLREAHTPFMSACRERKHHGWKVHDAMTLLIWGETAAVARMKKIIAEDLDPTIGLNHQEDIGKMRILTAAKWIYARFTRKSESWEDQVQRAVSTAQARLAKSN